MKLVELKCKNCGATLKTNPEEDEITCKYCQTTFKLDDEVKHVKLDDMEKFGYEFEKGRKRAQQENKASTAVSNYSQPQKKNNKTLWLVLAWIFLLPFTATYFIIKSNKLDKKKKIIIIVVMWIIFIIIGATSNSQEEEDKKTRIVECFSQETYDKLDELIGIDNIDGYFSSSYACDNLNLKNKQYKKIDIEMDENNLLAIKLDNKYIYNIDETVDIYDPITLRINQKNEESEALFGKQENNAYYNNEKTIRKFVTAYNKIADTKITKVTWEKNHQIASVVYNDKTSRLLSGTQDGFLVEFEFGNGTATLSEYEKIFMDIIKTFDTTVSDNDINSAFESARSNNNEVFKINENVSIKYQYVKEKVGYKEGNRYMIDITSSTYNK